MNDSISEQLKNLVIPGRVAIAPGNGGLPKVTVTTDSSTAEVYLHGAHVTGFQKKGEPPLLFMSASSVYQADKAIRGGVPVIFPWFGSREGAAAHGFARTTGWDLIKTIAEPNGAVTLRFHLPLATTESSVDFTVTVTDKLTMAMTVKNTSATDFSFENCLHTYFTVGDINAVSVSGLKGVEYVDKVDGNKRKRETDDVIHIRSEVDRTYLNTKSPTEIRDENLKRSIRIDKSGSASTVVWNPWIAKSKAMPDFGDEEYQRMICVESGNVGENKITLKPGAVSVLQVVIS